MNIYQKLLAVRKAVPYLQKASQGHQYNYTGSSQVLGAVREKLDELGLILITKVVDHNVLAETVENVDKYNNNKKTTTYFTELTLEYTWVNAEKPEETITIPFYAQGVDIAGEKGVGKALTYSEKYFMLKQFNIATDQDDPDKFQQKLEQSMPPKVITAEQVGELKTLALKFAELRGQKLEAVYKVLKITDIEKVPEGIAFNHIATLKNWIDKAEKESA